MLSLDRATASRKPDARTATSAESSTFATTPLRTVTSDRVRAEACLHTGQELSKAGQDEHAIAQFQRARSFDANLKGVAHPLAVCYDRLGRFDDARREYELALREAPKDALLLNDFGMHHLQREDWTQAERCFREALQRNPKHPRATTNLGIALAEQGRYDEAEAVFARAATRAAAANNVAMFLARHGRRADAEAKFRQALTLEPSLQPAADGLARLTAAPVATARVE
jgi:Tfp pilus assembly protein PilF